MKSIKVVCVCAEAEVERVEKPLPAWDDGEDQAGDDNA
jgi:hypothetical protein